MSTGTNKERIEQNNIKLEKIKNQVSNLPEYQDIEPIYASGDFNQVKVVGSGAYSYCKGYMSVQNSNSSFKIYKLNDDGTSTEIYSKSNTVSSYGIYAYLIDVIDNKLYFHCYIQYSEYAGNTLSYSVLDLDTLQVTGKTLSGVGYGENNIYGTLVYTGGGLISHDSVWYKYTSIDWKNNKVNYVSTFDNSGAIHYFNDRIFGYKDYYTQENKIHNTISKSNKIITDTFNPVFIPRTNDMICMSGGKLYYFNSDGSVGDYIKDLLIPSNAKFQWIDGDYYVDTVNKIVYKFDVTTLELNQVMSVQSVTNLSRKVTPYFSTTGVGTFFLEANNDVNTLMGYKFYGKDYYPAGSNWANTESILEGSYAYTSSGIQIIGTMPNNGELNYTPSTEEQTIPKGYTSGGTVAGDSNLVANNIRLGTTIFGVEGNLEADKPDQTKTATPTIEEQVITPDTGYELASVTVEAVTSSIDSNIVAENIKKDVSILGVTGTYEGSTGAIDSAEYNELVNMTYNIRNILNLETIVKNNMSVRIDNIRTSNKYLIDIVSTILNLTDFSSNPSLLLSWTDGNGNQLMFGAYCINGYNRVSVRETTKNDDSSVTSITYDYYNEDTVNLTGNSDYISAFEQYGEGWFTSDRMTMSYRVVPELPLDLTKYVGKTFTVSKNGIENDLILSCLVNMLSSIIFVQGSGV